MSICFLENSRRKVPTREKALIRHALSSLMTQAPITKKARQSAKPYENMFHELSDARKGPDCLLNLPTTHLTPSPIRQVCVSQAMCSYQLITVTALVGVGGKINGSNYLDGVSHLSIGSVHHL